MTLEMIPKLVSIVESNEAFGDGSTLVYFDDEYKTQIKGAANLNQYFSDLDVIDIPKQVINIETAPAVEDTYCWGSQASTESLRCLLQSARLARLNIIFS